MRIGPGDRAKVERGASAHLQSAFETAMAFPTSRGQAVQVSAQELAQKAGEEVSFGRVMVDARGLTAGTRLHVLDPARAVLADWMEARRGFDVAIEPHLGDIHAVRYVEGEITGLATRRDEQIAQADQEFERDHKFVQLRDSFEKAQARFLQMEHRHANRAANMAAHSVLYWAALLLLGAAEWLINYDVFVQFTSVVAIAAGATIVMGLLLAFAAHGHGMLLKQYSYRFGQDKEAGDRFSDWRLFALATFSLTVVLAAAAGSRYAVVMRQMADNAAPNLLGADAAMEYNPVHDILLSLLWNVMAWAAGVFVAYFAHDKDPDFMDATGQQHRAARRYNRARRPLVDRQRTIEAQFAREKAASERTAATRSTAATTERKLLEQVDAHEAALVNALASAARVAAQAYHANMAQLAASQRGALTLEREGGGAMSPGEFRAQPVSIDAVLIRSLV